MQQAREGAPNLGEPGFPSSQYCPQEEKLKSNGL